MGYALIDERCCWVCYQDLAPTARFVVELDAP